MQMGEGGWIEEMTDAPKSVAMLDTLDTISTSDLTGPARYPEIKFSGRSFYNQNELPSDGETEELTSGFGLDFSNPPEMFIQVLEQSIENLYSVGEVNQTSTAEKLAEISVEAGVLGKRIKGELGYVLMSDFAEYLSQDELEDSIPIPSFFLEEKDTYSGNRGFWYVNGQLKSRDIDDYQTGLTHGFYLYEGELRCEKDRKLALVTEDETAVAWLAGRTLGYLDEIGEFDIDEEFEDAYNQAITDYLIYRDF